MLDVISNNLMECSVNVAQHQTVYLPTITNVKRFLYQTHNLHKNIHICKHAYVCWYTH